MIEYLALVLAIPLGFVLAKLTKDEKEIYSKTRYFPFISFVLAIASVIFFAIDKQIALTLTFIFLTIFVWNRV